MRATPAEENQQLTDNDFTNLVDIEDVTKLLEREEEEQPEILAQNMSTA